MADFKLDIDYPVDIVKKESLEVKPEQIPYSQNNIRYRHYGRFVQDMIKIAIDYEEGEEKKQLLKLIANHMKKITRIGIRMVWKIRKFWMTCVNCREVRLSCRQKIFI